MKVFIRRALPDDAGALVALHNRAWREAYGHLAPAEFFDSRDARSKSDTTERRRQIEGGGARRKVSTEGSELLEMRMVRQ